MKPTRFCSVLATIILCGLLFNSTARAQFTGDYETNIISGTTVDWTGTYAVGSNAVYDFLGIDSGGVLASDAGGIGIDGDSSGNDAVSVSGTGSVWSNSNDLVIGFRSGSQSSDNNSLTIADGGAVFDNNATMSGTNNAVVVTGVGSTWNNSGSLTVGFSVSDNDASLTIADGGVVSDGSCNLIDGGSYHVLVTGSGSVWNNRSDLNVVGAGPISIIISNGGIAYDGTGSIAGEANNTVLVTGPGSVWSNRNDLLVMGDGLDSLIISNGGAVFCSGATMASRFVGVEMVTGSGSAWRIGGTLFTQAFNTLTVADEGIVSASDLTGGGDIIVSGGALYVTNGLGTGALTLQSDGTLTLNSGTITVDGLIAVDALAYVTFNGGTLSTKATTISNGVNFVVGDGVDAATFKLDSGGSGFHSFANGLSISSNAALRGNGTIVGSTVVNGGGVLAPGSITFSNSLTLASGSTFAVELDGAAAGQYDQIIALGTVSVSNSVLSLSLGYAPSVGDTFTIISNLGPDAVFGIFVDPQGDVLTNNATFLAGGTAFEISYEGNADGQDVTLTAVVPEPGAWLLTVLAVAVLLGNCHSRRRCGTSDAGLSPRLSEKAPAGGSGPTKDHRDFDML